MSIKMLGKKLYEIQKFCEMTLQKNQFIHNSDDFCLMISPMATGAEVINFKLRGQQQQTY